MIEDCSHAHGSMLGDTNIGNWGRVAGFSLQMSKPLPSIEGGIAVYQDQEAYERATTFGNYDLPSSFPEGSPYRKYQGTAFGWKFRMHPASAILAEIQLQRLDENNRIVISQVRKLNDRITQLPGLSEPTCRPDMKRVYYSTNLMFLDEAKAGMSRAACVKALEAEGVSVSSYGWSLLHKLPVLPRGEMVAPRAGRPRQAARLQSGQQHGDQPAADARRGSRVGRAIRQGVREGLGASGEVRQGVVGCRLSVIGSRHETPPHCVWGVGVAALP